MNRTLGLLLWVFASAVVSAAPLSRDLGDHLVYHRIHSLPAELPATKAARPQAYVIDVRYAESDAGGATALQAWIRFHATPPTPVFVLVNAATEPALLALLAARGAGPNVVVLGAVHGTFAPDIAIEIPPENERLAYDALEQGAELAALLSENADKVRNDEARLANDHSPENAERSAASKAGNRAPTPPLDTTLQRAVHLHRALRALKKI